MVTEIDLSEVDSKIREEVKDLLIRIGTEITNEAKKEAPVSSGELRQSIQIHEKDSQRIILGTKKEYAAPVEYGTEPHYPPIAPLKKWVRRKLGVEEDVAYAVQQKIGQEGTEPNPFMGRAIGTVKEDFET